MKALAADRTLPATRNFWEGLEEGEIRLRWCPHRKKYFLPLSRWADQGSGPSELWKVHSGMGHIYSYNILNVRHGQGHEATKQGIAVVELDNGPRIVAQIELGELGNQRLAIDAPVQLIIRDSNHGPLLSVSFDGIEEGTSGADS